MNTIEETIKMAGFGKKKAIAGQIKSLKPSTTTSTVEDKSSVAKWAKDAHKWVVDNEISDGQNPQNPVTRQEVWVMLERMHNLK